MGGLRVQGNGCKFYKEGGLGGPTVRLGYRKGDKGEECGVPK